MFWIDGLIPRCYTKPLCSNLISNVFLRMVVSQAQLKQLLEKWVDWIFPQAWDPLLNAGLDANGNATMLLNKENPTWFLSGHWDSRSKTRPINVKEKTPLFVVVASSHAIAADLQQLPPNKQIPNPKPQDLLQHARNVHALWNNTPALTINNQPAQLQPVPTDIKTPLIRDASYYKILRNIRGDTFYSMATVADVHLLNSVGIFGTPDYDIVLSGQSAKSVPLNEDAYTIDVTYKVHVIQ